MMMNTEQKLELALQKVSEISELVENNEYEQFFVSHLLPTEFEIKRQLTNIRSNLTIKE
jgi:hypothetical protein